MNGDKIYSLTAIRHPESKVPLVLRARNYPAETMAFLRYRLEEIYPEEDMSLICPGCQIDLKQHMIQMFEMRPFEAAKMADEGTIQDYMREKLLLADKLRMSQDSYEMAILASREGMVNVEALTLEAFKEQLRALSELLLKDIRDLPPEIPPETFLKMALVGVRPQDRSQLSIRLAPAEEVAAGVLLYSWLKKEELPSFLTDRERKGIYLQATTLKEEAVWRTSELMVDHSETLEPETKTFLVERMTDIVRGRTISKPWQLPSLLTMSDLMLVLRG